MTCTGPTSNITDGEKRIAINGIDAGDDYTVWYSSYNFPTLQSLVGVSCDTAPTIYRDARDSQLYYVAKLPDDKCWMLDNLRYKPNGDTAGTNQAGFSAVQVWSGYLTIDGNPYTNEDSGKYIDPISEGYCHGSANISSENVTKCGLLYNWFTATAGTGDQSLNTAGAEATGSICPINWRLARGGYKGVIGNDFDALNAIMAGYVSNQDSNYWQDYDFHFAGWQPSGSFHGVFSGTYGSSFSGQGDFGAFWSPLLYNWTLPHALFFSGSHVYSGMGYDDRFYGFGVRCVVGT
jgi:uncharacterized protein (TIGR02145 family)